MTKQEQIREALAAQAAKYGPLPTVIGKVVSVQEAANTCVVEDDGLAWHDVQLMPALVSNKSMRIVPTIGSTCILVTLECEGWWLVWAASIEAWELHTDGVDVQVSKDGLLVKKGLDSLQNILVDLITEIQLIYAPKNVAHLKLIETRIKQLLNHA